MSSILFAMYDFSKLKIEKRKLREIILRKRNRIPLSELLQKEDNITQKVTKLKQLKKAHHLSIYISTKKEVATKQLINYFFKKGINVYLPTFSQKLTKYVLTRFLGWKDLKVGPFQIPQPAKINPVDPSLVEVAIIPGVAFAKDGTRLGYGQGVFDKLFSKSNCIKIGLAYDFQILEKIPHRKHDLKMDLVISESKIIKPKYSP